MKELSDSDPMPMGKKYKDVAMADVPADYLIWLYENDKCTPMVKAYIEYNMQALKIELEKLKNERYPKRCCDCQNLSEGIYGWSKATLCRLDSKRVNWRDPACENFE